MNGSKCSKCGLVNLESDLTCKRCDSPTWTTGKSTGPTLGSMFKSAFYTILALALVGSAAMYIFSGVERSYDQVGASETKRLASQPKVQPTEQTRTQFEKQQAGHYGTAVQNSNGLAQSQKHNEEIDKLMKAPK